MCQSIAEQTGLVSVIMLQSLSARIIDAARSSAVDHLWTIFEDEIMAGVNKFIPQRKIKIIDSCPWITGKLHKKIKRRDRAYKASKKTGKPSVEMKFQKLKHEVQRDLRQAYWRYVEKVITLE